MAVQAGTVIRVTPTMLIAGAVTVQNVFHVKCTVAPTGDDTDVMEDMAAWMDAAYTYVYGKLTNVLTFVDIKGFNESSDAPLPTAAWPSLVVGGSSQTYLPQGNAGLILFRTAFAKVVGRKFLGGLVQGDQQAGELVADMISALVSFAITIHAGPDGTASGGTYVWGIKDKHGLVQPVTDFVVKSVMAYQRRRRPGRGI